MLSRLIITTFRSREGLLRKEEATEEETRGEGVGVCSFISLSALLASIITYREGVPLWTAELNDLTVPESAEARE